MTGLLSLSSFVGQPMVRTPSHLVESAVPNSPMRMQAHKTGPTRLGLPAQAAAPGPRARTIWSSHCIKRICLSAAQLAHTCGLSHTTQPQRVRTPFSVEAQKKVKKQQQVAVSSCCVLAVASQN